jgi:hypothetical protein
MFLYQLFQISDHWVFKKTVASAILVKPKNYTYPRDKQIQLLFLEGTN